MMTSRSRSCRSPRRRAPPRTLKARWVEGGLALKEFEVSEQDVRAQIFAQTAIPPELQILESDGVVVNGRRVECDCHRRPAKKRRRRPRPRACCNQFKRRRRRRTKTPTPTPRRTRSPLDFPRPESCSSTAASGERRPPSTPSTRRLLDGVAMSVPHRSTEPARPRHRREMT